MRNAFRSQRCEDREAPVGGFAKNSIKPLSGFDDVLNGTIPVIRRRLDTMPRRSDLGTLAGLSAPQARLASRRAFQEGDRYRAQNARLAPASAEARPCDRHTGNRER
jgi:hypothetical protein